MKKLSKPKTKPKPKTDTTPDSESIFDEPGPSKGKFSPLDLFPDSESDMDVCDVSQASSNASTDVAECESQEERDVRKRRKRKAEPISEVFQFSITDDCMRQAVDAKTALIDYCLDVSSRITQDQASFILKRVNALAEIVGTLSAENNRLIGHLEERSSILRTLSSPSYADKVKSSALKIPALSKVNKPVRGAQQVLIIRPSEAMKCKSSDDTKRELMKTLNPKEHKIHVRNLRKIRDNALLVETETKDDIAKITGSAALKEKGFKVEQPGKKGPRILIYDVQSSLSEQEITDAIYEQNSEIVNGIPKETFQREFKLQFRVGKRRENVTNWVAEVTPLLRNRIRKQSRIYLEWQCCRIQDFIGISRCYQCQGFGHIAKFCRHEKTTCGHCAEDGHKVSECLKKNAPAKCASCNRFGKPSQHSIFDKNCPAYKFALERIVNKIDYGV